MPQFRTSKTLKHVEKTRPENSWRSVLRSLENLGYGINSFQKTWNGFLMIWELWNQETLQPRNFEAKTRPPKAKKPKHFESKKPRNQETKNRLNIPTPTPAPDYLCTILNNFYPDDQFPNGWFFFFNQMIHSNRRSVFFKQVIVSSTRWFIFFNQMIHVLHTEDSSFEQTIPFLNQRICESKYCPVKS